MSEHYAVVEQDERKLAWIAERRPVTDEDRAIEWTAHIECSDPMPCPAWQECTEGWESHEGFDPDDEDSPAYEEEEFEIHGVVHTWRDGWGWTIPYDRCAVIEHIDSLETDEIDMARPGKWLLDVDWDDSECYISVVKEVTGNE